MKPCKVLVLLVLVLVLVLVVVLVLVLVTTVMGDAAVVTVKVAVVGATTAPFFC
jgi:hypothetical protein